MRILSNEEAQKFSELMKEAAPVIGKLIGEAVASGKVVITAGGMTVSEGGQDEEMGKDPLGVE